MGTKVPYRGPIWEQCNGRRPVSLLKRHKFCLFEVVHISGKDDFGLRTPEVQAGTLWREAPAGRWHDAALSSGRRRWPRRSQDPSWPPLARNTSATLQTGQLPPSTDPRCAIGAPAEHVLAMPESYEPFDDTL